MSSRDDPGLGNIGQVGKVFGQILVVAPLDLSLIGSFLDTGPKLGKSSKGHPETIVAKRGQTQSVQSSIVR
jgi:hypothetical protein